MSSLPACSEHEGSAGDGDGGSVGRERRGAFDKEFHDEGVDARAPLLGHLSLRFVVGRVED